MKRIAYSLLAVSLTLLMASGAQGAGPADINGLALWLDSADSGTLTTVDDGGTLRVSQWQDKSGQNNHFTQTDVSLAPAMTVAPDNALPSVSFNGHYLASDTMTPSAVTGGTWFSVYHMVSWDGNQTILSKGYGSNFQVVLRPSSGMGSIDQNNYGLISGGAIAESDPWAVNIDATTLEEIHYDSSKASDWISFYENGDGIGSSSAISGPLVADDNAMTLGADMTDSGIGNFLHGHLLEVVFYDRALTAGERDQVGYYLASKHGIDASYVPEPATMAVLALGGLQLLRRRRKA